MLFSKFEQIPPISIGKITIDSQRRSVKKDGQPIILTTKEFDVLYLLASHPGWAFTRAQIYEAVWRENYSSTYHAVENTIFLLRKKIELDSRNPVYIETLIGFGYRFKEK